MNDFTSFQTTFKNPVHVTGICLHSGVATDLTLTPAPVDTGIIFKRTDITDKDNLIKALYSNIVDTRMCSCFGNSVGATASLTEHLMATLHAYGISNAVIEIGGPEVPIMDGSAQNFVELFEKAGTVQQDAPRRFLKIKKNVSFTDDKGTTVELSPAEEGLTIDFEIDFKAPIIGHQQMSFHLNLENFKQQIAYARTFGLKQEIDMLHAMGLGKGGSLDNAVVVDNDTILNPDGLRDKLEFVRHKILDSVGDLYQANMPIIGNYKAAKSGHYHNNMILREVFKDPANFEIITL